MRIDSLMTIFIPDESGFPVLHAKRKRRCVQQSAGVSAWEGLDGALMLLLGEGVVGDVSRLSGSESLCCFLVAALKAN